MATLYVETNLVMSIARGQDVDAARLLDTPPPHRLAMPAVCVMEAVSAFQRVRSDHNRFWNDDLARWARDPGRDLTSAAATAMLGHLGRARVEADQLIGDVRARLLSALDDLVRRAVLIPPDPTVVTDSFRNQHLGQLTDNLILATVVADAGTRDGPKALLTGNVKDFGDPAVVALLRAVGIDGPYATAADAVRWLAGN